MDSLTFIRHSLQQVHERLLKSLEGLSDEQLLWRPAPHANCIGELLFHSARTEDRLGRTDMGLGPEVWETGAWHRRFGLPKQLTRDDDYRVLRAGGLPAPRLADMVAYLKAVQSDTLAKLPQLTEADLDRTPATDRPPRTIAALLRHRITHMNNHHGQIDYIRGLFQQGWDLPRGTGVEQR